MSNWDNFAKYIGVQGILGIMLVGGYIAAIFAKVTLPDAYSSIMTLVLGFYFAKNGVSALSQLVSIFRPQPAPSKKGR